MIHCVLALAVLACLKLACGGNGASTLGMHFIDDFGVPLPRGSVRIDGCPVACRRGDP
ncbi:hypothetical protein ebA4321 [Aromatoleum aromaticum EbN1]|uniref:Uncharacterized protein n=1 Tax=Aromatoleum aromaticum (strain DSM 19018 / LMG 30748 / EbN1) TaxID=76114 RepID=Q5P292_AROAE|nr:hypothetical protein ebA4321 [Aromatoleum aromaticum EbN1]